MTSTLTLPGTTAAATERLLEPPHTVRLCGATIVTQDDDRRIVTGDVVIREGVIEDVVEGGGGEGVEARGLVLIPGLVQAHVHLVQTLFRNYADDLELLDWLQQKIWPFEAAHTAETVRLSATLGIVELLGSGTTCLLDMGTIRHTEEVFRAASELGIRANIGKCLMDHPERNPAYLQEPQEPALREALELVDRWHGGHDDRLRACLAPRFAPSCTEELLREVGRLSRERDLLIHTHASENEREIAWVRELFGKGNVEYFEHVGLLSERLCMAHGIWLDDAEREAVREAGAAIAHCPSSNLKLASGIAPVTDLLRRGITVALGADGAPCNNRLDGLAEMRLAALLQKIPGAPRALNAQEALDLATRGGAKALRWFDRIGSLEAGKRADIVALNLSSPPAYWAPPARLDDVERGRLLSAIAYSAQPHQVAWTLVDGKLVYAQTPDGPWITGGHVDFPSLARQVNEAMQGIRARVAQL